MEPPTDERDGALDPLELRAWRGLIETTALLRRRSDERLLADSGLSGSDDPVLVTLHELGGATIRSTELAERIGWEQSRLSRHLARMERRGLVGRRRHEADNRGSEVFITDAGRTVFLAAAKAHSGAVRTLFADALTRPQLDARADAMETLARHLTSDRPDARPRPNPADQRASVAPKPAPSRVVCGRGRCPKVFDPLVVKPFRDPSRS